MGLPGIVTEAAPVRGVVLSACHGRSHRADRVEAAAVEMPYQFQWYQPGGPFPIGSDSQFRAPVHTVHCVFAVHYVQQFRDAITWPMNSGR